MENLGFREFIGINESADESYSISFEHREDHEDLVNSIFIEELNRFFKQEFSPFLCDISKDSSDHVSIRMRVNPNDFLIGLTTESEISLKIKKPVFSGTQAAGQLPLTPNAFFRSIDKIKGRAKTKIFIARYEGGQMKKLGFSLSPDHLNELKLDAAARAAISTESKYLKLIDGAKPTVDLLYSYCLSESQSDKIGMLKELTEELTIYGRYLAALRFLNEAVKVSETRQTLDDDPDSIVKTIRNSEGDSAMEEVKSSFEELMVLSEKGKLGEIESAERLSKMFSALLEKYDTIEKVYGKLNSPIRRLS